MQIPKTNSTTPCIICNTTSTSEPRNNSVNYMDYAKNANSNAGYSNIFKSGFTGFRISSSIPCVILFCRSSVWFIASIFSATISIYTTISGGRVSVKRHISLWLHHFWQQIRNCFQRLTESRRLIVLCLHNTMRHKRLIGVEPTSSAWKAEIIAVI